MTWDDLKRMSHTDQRMGTSILLANAQDVEPNRRQHLLLQVAHHDEVPGSIGSTLIGSGGV